MTPEETKDAFAECGLFWANFESAPGGGRVKLLRGRREWISVIVRERPAPYWRVTQTFINATRRGHMGTIVLSTTRHDTFEVCVKAAEDWILTRFYGNLVEDSARRLGAFVTFNPNT